MRKEATRLIRLCYGIAVSVMCVITGVLLMAACLQIYRSGGEQIYTPEKVAAAFSPIAMPVYITLALIAGSFLLDIVLPAEKKRSPQKQYPMLLRKAYERVDMQLCNPELKKKLKKEQDDRRLHLILTLVLLAIGSVIFLVYALNGSHFDDVNINGSMVGAIWWLLTCMAIPFGYSVFAAYYCRRSMQRELELVKLAPKAVNRPEPAPISSERKLLYIRLAILGLALGILVGGFVAGGTADVLAKAVAICTECVGLG